MATKVKLTSSEEIQRSALSAVLRELNIPIKDIHIPQSDKKNCYVLFHTEDEADMIFTDDCTSALSTTGYFPLPNEKTLAGRTVFVRKIGHENLKWTEKEICDAINSGNDGIVAAKVVKISTTQTIKLELKSREMANKVIRHGIYLFNFCLREIEAEKYIEVIVCMKCYKLGDHTKEKCPKPADYKCCSTCANEGHTYHSCTSREPKCVNCKGDHYTLSKKCIKRKEIVTNLRKSIKETTYAAKVTVTPSASNNINSVLESPAVKSRFDNQAKEIAELKKTVEDQNKIIDLANKKSDELIKIVESLMNKSDAKIDKLCKVVENQSNIIDKLTKQHSSNVQPLTQQAHQLLPSATSPVAQLSTIQPAPPPPSQQFNHTMTQDSAHPTTSGNLNIATNINEIEIVITDKKLRKIISSKNIRDMYNKNKIMINSKIFLADFCIEFLEKQTSLDAFIVNEIGSQSTAITRKQSRLTANNSPSCQK